MLKNGIVKVPLQEAASSLYQQLEQHVICAYAGRLGTPHRLLVNTSAPQQLAAMQLAASSTPGNAPAGALATALARWDPPPQQPPLLADAVGVARFAVAIPEPSLTTLPSAARVVTEVHSQAEATRDTVVQSATVLVGAIHATAVAQAKLAEGHAIQMAQNAEAQANQMAQSAIEILAKMSAAPQPAPAAPAAPAALAAPAAPAAAPPAPAARAAAPAAAAPAAPAAPAAAGTPSTPVANGTRRPERPTSKRGLPSVPENENSPNQVDASKPNPHANPHPQP